MTNVTKVLACFDEIGLDFKLSHFDSRLMAQKVTYLLQELGVELGYEFNFYVRGTYSPALTKALFRVERDSEQTRPNELTAAEKNLVARLRDNAELRPHMLEVMAAYRYLRRHGRSDAEALTLIKTTKPFIPERDVAVGVSRCKRLFPDVTDADIASLKEEMADWEDEANNSIL